MSSSIAVAAVLLYEGCTIAEVIEAATRLHNHGVDLEWVSVDGQPIRDQSGLALGSTVAIAAIDEELVDLLIVPGGDPGVLIGNEQVRSLVRRVAADGLIGAIFAGVLVLGDAGVLAGRRVTHNYRSPWSPPEVADHVAPLLAEAVVEPDRSVGVVADRSVITALPNATAEFAIRVCRAAGIYDDATAERLTRHLQGEFVPELFLHDSGSFDIQE